MLFHSGLAQPGLTFTAFRVLQINGILPLRLRIAFQAILCFPANDAKEKYGLVGECTQVNMLLLGTGKP